MNSLYIVGRVVGNVELKRLESGQKFVNVTLAIPRHYKNAEGIYETDFIDCVIYNYIAENVSEYVEKGDLIGIRGRLQSDYYKKEDGTNAKKLIVVGESVSYLAARKKDDE